MALLHLTHGSKSTWLHLNPYSLDPESVWIGPAVLLDPFNRNFTSKHRLVNFDTLWTLTHDGSSDDARLCLKVLSSWSKKANALLHLEFLPPEFLLQKNNTASPIRSQLKLNSKYPRT